MDNEKIVETIKNICKARKITVGQLEKNIGLSQGLISKWKSTTPSLDKIIDIANYFKLSIDAVIGRDINVETNIEFIRVACRRTKSGEMEWDDVSHDAKLILNAQNDGKTFMLYPSVSLIPNRSYEMFSHSSSEAGNILITKQYIEPTEGVSLMPIFSLYVRRYYNEKYIQLNIEEKELSLLFSYIKLFSSEEYKDEIIANEVMYDFINSSTNKIENYDIEANKQISELISSDSFKSIKEFIMNKENMETLKYLQKMFELEIARES